VLSLSKSESKGRILQIYKLLIEKTDSEHFVTIQQILDYLESIGVSAYRKTIQNDIEELQRFGVDIRCIKSSSNLYYIYNSIFTLPELKLLVDAVEASQFITQQKSAELIGKLSDMTSIYNADNLCRHIYLSHRMKSDNEEIYDVVDKLHSAINNRHQISFLYYEYDNMKNKVLRNNGQLYQVSPYGMTWEDGRYYVVAYSVNKRKIVTYRADRMSDVTELDIPVVPEPDNFKIADYSLSVFRMYDDEPITTVTLQCENKVMKSIIDRFGIDVDTEPTENGYFIARVNVSPSQTFFGWIFQFNGAVKIIKPVAVKQKFNDSINKFINK